MSENLSRSLLMTKQPLRSRGGIVAAQNQRAADIGAAVLRQGGNAVDAAVATAFALAALEPWMSGLGGIGYMMIYDARLRRAHCIDFGAVSPAALDPADYPLVGGEAGDLFGWPAVAEDRNILGYPAIAVPGQPDGMRLAVESFGTKRFADLLGPAIEAAETGIEVDWFLSLIVASAAKDLARFPASRAYFLPDGQPPSADYVGPAPRLRNEALLATMKHLAAAGPRDYYEGALARRLLADLQRGGSKITAADLARYQARRVDPLLVTHAGKTLALAPGLTAGPTLADALRRAAPALPPQLGPQSFVAYAEALSAVYHHRFATMGDHGGDKSCTTHLCVIDRDGNMVALTQTLLSLFGSRVMLPESGLMMNNGIMWFDTRPGRPNSIRAGKRPLSNMLPSIGLDGDKPWLAIGASGGRRILPAVMQLISFLADYRMELGEAFNRPRIDVSLPDQPSVDPLLAPEIRAALEQRFPQTVEKARIPLPLGYACPSAILIEGGGMRVGMTEAAMPWAGTAAAD